MPASIRVAALVTISSSCTVDRFTVAESIKEKSNAPSVKKSDPISEVSDSQEEISTLPNIKARIYFMGIRYQRKGSHVRLKNFIDNRNQFSCKADH